MTLHSAFSFTLTLLCDRMLWATMCSGPITFVGKIYVLYDSHQRNIGANINRDGFKTLLLIHNNYIIDTN